MPNDCSVLQIDNGPVEYTIGVVRTWVDAKCVTYSHHVFGFMDVAMEGKEWLVSLDQGSHCLAPDRDCLWLTGAGRDLKVRVEFECGVETGVEWRDMEVEDSWDVGCQTLGDIVEDLSQVFLAGLAGLSHGVVLAQHDDSIW